MISSEASSRASSSTSIGTWPDSQRVRAARAVAGAAGSTGSVASRRSIPLATMTGRRAASSWASRSAFSSRRICASRISRAIAIS